MGRASPAPALLIALLFDNLFGNIWTSSCKLPLLIIKQQMVEGIFPPSAPGLNGMLAAGAGPRPCRVPYHAAPRLPKELTASPGNCYLKT